MVLARSLAGGGSRRGIVAGLFQALVLGLVLPLAAETGAEELPIRPRDRAAAEAWWVMMENMGAIPQGSPVLEALRRRGVEPAPMRQLDTHDGPGHQQHAER